MIVFICCLFTLLAVDFFPLTSAGVNSTGEDIGSLLINNCLPLRAPAVVSVALLSRLLPVFLRLPTAGANSLRCLCRHGERITLDYVPLCLPAAATDCFSQVIAVTLLPPPKFILSVLFFLLFVPPPVSLTDQPDARKRDQVCRAGADGAEVRLPAPGGRARSPAAPDETHKIKHIAGGKK